MLNNKILVIIFFIKSIVISYAQSPNWTVIPSDFEYSMTIVAKLNIAGVQLTHPNDMVSAFVGDKIRGVAKLVYVPQKSSYYAYLTVYSNFNEEEIQFQIYEYTKNKVTSINKKLNFKSNLVIGNINQSYSIAEPALNNQADINRFSFKGIETVGSKIDLNGVDLVIYDIHDVTELTPVFELSKGAKLLVDSFLKLSGEFTDNFSNTVKYKIVSEDESTIKEYTINVLKTEKPALFYKQNAVCYNPGAIKVLTPYEGRSVKIFLNGVLLDEKFVTFGEVYFNKLESGSYLLQLGDKFKYIEILLKTN